MHARDDYTIIWAIMIIIYQSKHRSDQSRPKHCFDRDSSLHNEESYRVMSKTAGNFDWGYTDTFDFHVDNLTNILII